MNQLEEMKARAEKMSGLCPDYMRAGIRHLQRNCDIECPTHDDDYENCKQPDRYDGDTMAQVLTENAKLIAALEAMEALHPKALGGTPDGNFADICSACQSYYPCITVSAITEALQ